jgi:hypothetical protein
MIVACAEHDRPVAAVNPRDANRLVNTCAMVLNRPPFSTELHPTTHCASVMC